MIKSNTDSNSLLNKLNGLCVFVIVYVSLFMIAAIILFTSVSHIHRTNDYFSYNTYSNNTNYGVPVKYAKEKSYDTANLFLSDAAHTYSSLNDLLGYMLFKQNDSNLGLISAKRLNSGLSNTRINVQWPYSYSTVINCTSIQEVYDLKFVSGGWTKLVYQGKFRDQHVAVKIINFYGHDIQQCQKQEHESLNSCYEKAETKILKEIILLHELFHHNVIKMIGFCIPDTVGTIALVTELGEPLDLIHLLQISWEERLQLILGIGYLLEHLAHSPLGSLSMNDFQRQQFVLIDGELKLSDVDDLGVGEPWCENDEMCQGLSPQISSVSSEERKHSPLGVFNCINHHCIGHNSRVNIWHAGQHFVKLLLPLGAPTNMEIPIKNLLSEYELRAKSAEDGTSYILAATLDLVNHFKKGLYFNKSGGISTFGFKELKNSDLPGMYDYHCRNSMSTVSCVMSVLNKEEAVQFCVQDNECRAVVLTLEHTWTGRTIAVFKNGSTSPVERRGFTLLLQDYK